MKIYTPLPIFLLTAILMTSCKNTLVSEKENTIKQIALAEKEFEQMAATKGIAEAFTFFADSLAVIKRGNDSLIKGKEGIRNFYSAGYFKKASVKWSPDFIEVSEDGKMGYTYGKYVWTSTDSTGARTSSAGIFHTVWKKQADNSWKYVWD
jgi:ketosteroid isomerase-like protein